MTIAAPGNRGSDQGSRSSTPSLRGRVMGSLAIEPDHGRGSAASVYDLFVVHADADRAWVDGYLKHALGLDPARVFTPRDFRLGASTAGEFERGVTSSRFTLLVLSP